MFPAFAVTSSDRLIPLRQAVAEAVSVLSAAGVASPAADATALAAFVLDIPPTRLPAVAGINPDQHNRLRELTLQRAHRVPLQHLTGSAGFRYLELAVGPGVFIPRPETELLVGWGLAAVAELGRPTVVDLCSGSGAIALSVDRERGGARVYAVENDPGALVWLRRNATGTNINVISADATDPATLAHLDGHTDLVLCNPPYVPDATAVPPEVADHDPAAAVFGGLDGLDVIRGVIKRSAALLRPGGALAVEHDETHAASVLRLLRSAGAFGDIEDHRDLAGRPRFATARRLAD